MDTMMFMAYLICLTLRTIFSSQPCFVLYFCFPDSCFIAFSDIIQYSLLSRHNVQRKLALKRKYADTSFCS